MSTVFAIAPTSLGAIEARHVHGLLAAGQRIHAQPQPAKRTRDAHGRRQRCAGGNKQCHGQQYLVEPDGELARRLRVGNERGSPTVGALENRRKRE